MSPLNISATAGNADVDVVTGAHNTSGNLDIDSNTAAVGSSSINAGDAFPEANTTLSIPGLP